MSAFYPVPIYTQSSENFKPALHLAAQPGESNRAASSLMTPRKKNVFFAPSAPRKSNLKLGAAIRGRYDLRFNDARKSGKSYTSNHLSFDTLILSADYDSDTLYGAAQYRFYGGSFLYPRASGYVGYPGEVSFPLYAYTGIKLSRETKFALGIQSVPFDERFWGSGFLNTLGFVYGLEEVYNSGVTLHHVGQRYSYDVGYFPMAAPNAFGISEDSARYSVNIVKADPSVPNGSRNEERDMIVGSFAYQLTPGRKAKLVATASTWFSRVHNFTTRRDGTRRAFAVSLKGQSGPWHAKILAARQDIETRNPEVTNQITVGDYDAPFNIAAKGTIVFAEVGRSVDTGSLPFALSLFVNYARFFKPSGSGAPATERLYGGAFWTDKASGRVRIWSEALVGRNDPYVGAGQYSLGAATGGDNRYKVSALIIFGYYF